MKLEKNQKKGKICFAGDISFPFLSKDNCFHTRLKAGKRLFLVFWFCFVQRGVDRLEKKLRSIFIVVAKADIFGGLGGVDLAGERFQCGFHQRIHGCGSLTQVVERNGVDVVFVDGNFHIESLAIQFNRRGVDTGNVQDLGGIVAGCVAGFLLRAEHGKQQYQQENGKYEKDGGVDHLFHM